MGWNNPPDMVMTSGSSDTYGMEWLDKFYEQNHTMSTLECVKLQLSNFAVTILKLNQ